MSAGERVRREVREIGLVTLYFLLCFLLFLSLKKLILAEYHLDIAVLHTAVIGALVVAKVVVLLEKTSFGSRFRAGRLAVHVLWRSLSYTAIVFVVTLAERLVEASRASGTLAAGVHAMWARRDVHHFLAMNLCVALSFLIYNTFAEIDRRTGAGGLRRMFFER